MSRNKSSFNQLARNTGLDFNVITENEFMLLYMKYMNIALNRYKWYNLPPGLESRHIEKALSEKGQAFFYEKEGIGLICLPCAPINRANLYNDPVAVQVTAIGFSEQKKIEDGVRIINNDLAFPTNVYVRYYVDKICNVEKTIDKNLIQQRNPTLYRTTKDKEFSIKAALRKVENDEVAIVVDKDLVEGQGNGSLILDDIWKDFRALEYNQLKREYEKGLLQDLGINTTLNKASGVNVDEVNSNNIEIEMMLDLGYKTRLKAAEEINKKYNQNITVEKVIQSFKPLFDTSLSKKGGQSDE